MVVDLGGELMGDLRDYQCFAMGFVDKMGESGLLCCCSLDVGVI